MIVFKTYFKILKKNKAMILLYTFMLLGISLLNYSNNESSLSFESVKPDIYIIDNDKSVISKDLYSYLEENSNIKDIGNDEDKLKDAIFYRDLNIIVTIPEGYSKKLMNNEEVKVDVKVTGDYNSTLAKMMLERYVKVANFYSDKVNSEEELVTSVRNVLKSDVNVSMKSNLDTNLLYKMSLYFDFTNYSIIASLVFVICIILNVFKSELIDKRTIISNMNYKKFNKYLLICNLLFALSLFIIYTLFAVFLFGNTLFSVNGLLCVINMAIFMVCATSFAILMANLIKNKNALNGLVNVVALGTSFLCGAFVPLEWLPKGVIAIAHLFPSYYFIDANNIATTIETFNFSSTYQILINNVIVILFTVAFIILTNLVSKKNQTLG